MIHPGLSSGCSLGLENLKILAGSSCVGGPSGFARLVCAVLSCPYCCSPPFKSLAPLSYVAFLPSDDISRCSSDVEDWSVVGGVAAEGKGHFEGWYLPRWSVGTSELEPGRERTGPEVDDEIELARRGSG